jgi:hypothetical protein
LIISRGGHSVKKIIDVFKKAGFQAVDYKCKRFDATFEKDNMIFLLKEFGSKQELENWRGFQDEINFNIYLKVDNEKKLNIYFVLLIKFKMTLQDLTLFLQIEKDPYYCRKITVRDTHFAQDIQKLPFLPIGLDFEKSAGEIRTKTIHEFLQGVVENEKELNLTKKIFDLKDEGKIAEKIIEFQQKENSK